MAKNKKKSVSKVIVSQPTSIDTYLDKSIALSEQVIVLETVDILESAEQVRQDEQHVDNKPPQDIVDTIDIDNKTNDNIDEIPINNMDSTISPILETLNVDDLSMEYNIISSDEQNLEIIHILDMKNLENKTQDDIELTEIKIEKNDTQEQVSPQKKQTNCSRAWCSIL